MTSPLASILDRSTQVNHYIAFHSVEKMGHDYQPGEWFEFLSGKPEKTLRSALGGAAWVVVGNRDSGLRRYRLAGVFTPSKLAKLAEGWAIEGSGSALESPLDLTSMAWFSALLREQHNFSFGFSRIRGPEIIAGLVELASTSLVDTNHPLPGPMGLLGSNGSAVGLTEGSLTEGAAVQVGADRYERNPEARRLCIAHYGSRCVVCGFDFESRYGEIGAGFIHVHHVVPLSESGVEHEVDPVRDLRPVCPNCHAMIHRVKPAVGIEALTALLKGALVPNFA